jgi:hypothetical protein
METAPFQERLDTALHQVVETLRPLVATLVAELHAVRAAAAPLTPWCEWIEAAAAATVAATGRWPGRPPEDDDEALSDALAELLRASTALSAAWQGQPAEQPPTPPPTAEPVETEVQRLAREHRELLETARPWARVDGRPYDAAMYANLVTAAHYAFDLPELPMYLAMGLPTTAGLAASVARNANDDTFAALIDDAAAQQPLAIAVTLVRELMLMAQETQRPNLEAKAREHAVRLLRDANWADRKVWTDNRFHMRRLLGWTASISTEAEVRARIAATIEAEPQLLEPLLLGISEQSEQRDNQDWSRLLRIDVHIENPPAWFPTAEVAAEIRCQHPDLQPANRYENEGNGDDFSKLAAQILYINSRAK